MLLIGSSFILTSHIMTTIATVCAFLSLFLLVRNSSGHLCLIYPEQRGKLDISTSGSSTCFRHGAPCGGEPYVEGPMVTWFAGEQVFVRWQQNFNHYEVGYPGFMDIAVAPAGSDDFVQLAFVRDSYVFAQDYQHNFTALVNVPDIECDHCVVRARYQPHKPGETTFYQCGDLRIQKSKKNLNKKSSHLFNQTLVDSVRKFQDIKQDQVLMSNEFMLQGLAYNDLDADVLHFVNVSLSNGVTKPLNTLKMGISYQYGVAGAENQYFISDGITALNPEAGEMLTLYHKGGSMEERAQDALVFFTINGTVEVTLPLQNLNGDPVSSFLYVKPRTYVTFGILEDSSKKGNFHFILGQILYVPGSGLVYQRRFTTDSTENLYVNYQWAEFDPDSQRLYVLMGNENAPDSLNARIYTFDVNKGALIKTTEIQKSQYTFMSLQLYKGSLYTIAPIGDYSEKRPAYDLIKIDPDDGGVLVLRQVTPKGVFERYYGGTVFNGLDQSSGVLYKVLRVADTVADVIVSVDITRSIVQFSELCNLRHVHNLSLSRL